MKVLSVFCIVFSVVKASHLFNTDYDEQWEGYKKVFGRSYGAEEEGARRMIWERNVRTITKHNLEADIGLHSFRMGVNKFADMTPKEILRIKSCLLRTTDKSNATKVFRHPVDAPLPSSVDWRKQGYVTDIKDQGMCGSCWAFSATGSLEGQHKATTGQLISLSEQNLVDCSKKEGNEGCDGGLMDKAFEYVKKNKGIDTEDGYPYTGYDGKCRYQTSSIGATCKGFVDVVEGNETSLKSAVALVGPISVGIDASSEKFSFYKSGIFNNPKCSRTELDHGVLVVGYGSQNGKDYWIVKNSWGTSWGEDGYILMTRNQENQCGIASMASYPLM